MRYGNFFIASFILMTCLLSLPVTSQTVLEGPGYPGFDGKVDNIVTAQITDKVYMMTTHGGNYLVQTGEDGILMVDSRYEVMGPTIIKEIRKINNDPIRFVINTHFHGDHTGANGHMNNNGALLVAHDNVRITLSQEHYIEAVQSRFAAYPAEALPEVTFSDEMTLHVNGEDIQVLHTPNAHTDGDAVVYLKNSDVLASGDVFQRSGYPVFDRSNDGSFLGLLNGWKLMLGIIGPDTKIIQGHGPLATHADLKTAYKNMSIVKDRITKAIAEGKSRDDVIASRPTRGFDEQWPPKPMSPELIAGWFYDELMANN
jgi:cyclase